MSRFKVVNGSESFQLFRATVIDTGSPVMIGDEYYAEDGILKYRAICETILWEDAEAICRAMNMMEKADD